jgi:hypothetical protein
MHIGLVMTESVPEADLEYAEDVIVIGVSKAFTNFSLSGSYPRQAPVHNPYFSTLIIFV